MNTVFNEYMVATYPLDQIVDAQTAFMTKSHFGKIVLTINA